MNLGPQFSQPELPGMPRDRSLPTIQPHGKDPKTAAMESLADYGGEDGAWRIGKWPNNPDPQSAAIDSLFTPGENPRNNPLPETNWDDTVSAKANTLGKPMRFNVTEEFIPTWRVTSTQEFVNTDAIAHQVQHADPQHLTERPEVDAYTRDGAEHYDVRNGNHRLNAALARGQLFAQAEVSRPVWKFPRPGGS